MKWSIEPPASLTGDIKKDIQNIHEYLTRQDRMLSNIFSENIDKENISVTLQNELNKIDKIETRVKQITG